MPTTIYHKHHIIPKHMGGDNSPDNLTEPIPILKHAERHKELYAIFGHLEDLWAWKFLSKLPTKNIPLSEKQKRKLSIAHKGKKHPHKGNGPLSEETKRKRSLAMKGRIPWNKGKHKLTYTQRIGSPIPIMGASIHSSH